MSERWLSVEEIAEHELAVSTQCKLRQNLFHMLREADLISDQFSIQPAMLALRVAQLLASLGPDSLRIFPVSGVNIQRWLK